MEKHNNEDPWVDVDPIEGHEDIYPPSVDNVLAVHQVETSKVLPKLWSYACMRSKLFESPLTMATLGTRAGTDMDKICYILWLHYPSHEDFWMFALYGILRTRTQDGIESEQEFDCVVLRYYQLMSKLFKDMFNFRHDYVTEGHIAFGNIVPMPAHNQCGGMHGTRSVNELMAKFTMEAVQSLRNLRGMQYNGNEATDFARHFVSTELARNRKDSLLEDGVPFPHPQRLLLCKGTAGQRVRRYSKLANLFRQCENLAPVELSKKQLLIVEEEEHKYRVYALKKRRFIGGCIACST